MGRGWLICRIASPICLELTMLSFVFFIFTSQFSFAQESCIDLFSLSSQHRLSADDLAMELRARRGNGALAKYYKLVEGNSTLAQAKVILIGDIHGTPQNLFPTQVERAESRALELIKLYAQQGDVLFIEQAKESKARKNVPEKWRPYLQGNILQLPGQALQVKNWDSQKLVVISDQLLRDSIAFKEQILSGPENPDPLLLLDWYVSTLLFEHIAIELRDEFLAQQLENHLTGSTQGSGQSLSLNSSQKIFVIAGADHIHDGTGVIRDTLSALNIPYVMLEGRSGVASGDYGQIRQWALEQTGYSDRELDDFIYERTDEFLQIYNRLED
jgi:hypothetical protein